MDAIPAYNIDDAPPQSPASSNQLHVASLIAHVLPASVNEVASWLERQPRVEIHTQSPEGKFAIVMESDHEQSVLELLDALGQRPGVLNTALIYHEIIEDEGDI